MVNENSVWIIGTCNNINLWLDYWMGTTLVSMPNIPAEMFPSLDARLASVIINGKWKIPPPLFYYPMVAVNTLKIMLPVTPLPDRCVWKHAPDCLLTSKLAHQFLLHPLVAIDWPAIIWRACIPPSHSFVLWRLIPI